MKRMLWWIVLFPNGRTFTREPFRLRENAIEDAVLKAELEKLREEYR